MGRGCPFGNVPVFVDLLYLEQDLLCTDSIYFHYFKWEILCGFFVFVLFLHQFVCFIEKSHACVCQWGLLLESVESPYLFLSNVYI